MTTLASRVQATDKQPASSCKDLLVQGDAHLLAAEYDQALSDFLQAEKICNDWWDRQTAEDQLLATYVDAKRYEDAWQALMERQLFDASKYWLLDFRHVSIGALSGRYREILAVIDKAIETRPGDGKSYFYKSYLLRHMGRFREAFEQARRAELIDSNETKSFDELDLNLGLYKISRQSLKRQEKALYKRMKQALVKISFYANTNYAHCHGFLIASDQVVTARHCVSGAKLNDKINNVYAIPEGGRPLKTLGILWEPRAADFILLKVEKASHNFVPFRFALHSPKRGEDIYNLWLPDLFHVEEFIPIGMTKGRVIRRFYDSKVSLFESLMPSFTGLSGSPIVGNNGNVIGVLSTGKGPSYVHHVNQAQFTVFPYFTGSLVRKSIQSELALNDWLNSEERYYVDIHMQYRNQMDERHSLEDKIEFWKSHVMQHFNHLARAFVRLALLQHKHHAYEEALKSIDQAIGLDPLNYSFYLLKCQILYCLRRFDALIHQAGLAVRLRKSWRLDHPSQDPEVLLAEAYLEQHNYAKALEIVRGSSRITPTDDRFLALKGRIYARQKQYKKAVPLLQNLLRDFPYSYSTSDAAIELAYVYLQRNEVMRAEEVFHLSFVDGDPAGFLALEGWIALTKDQSTLAELNFRAALNRDPSHLKALSGLVLCLDKAGNTQEAAEIRRRLKALEASP